MAGKSIRTKEEKAGIVMEALSGSTSIAEICRRYNVTSSFYYKWRDAFIAGGTASLESGKSSDAVAEGD
ncbi:MAG: transposase, partial [Nitrososphaerota archaeon]